MKQLSKARRLMLVRHKTIDKMRVGDRFMFPGHSSFMIMTDMKQSSASGIKRLAVSENGLSEWMPTGTGRTYLLSLKAKTAALKTSSAVRQSILNQITYE